MIKIHTISENKISIYGIEKNEILCNEIEILTKGNVHYQQRTKSFITSNKYRNDIKCLLLKYYKDFNFLDNIDILNLSKIIEEKSGFTNLKIETNVEEFRNKKYLIIQSFDLVEQIETPCNMFISFKIECTISLDGQKDRYWFPLKYKYDHPSGGSNGYNFLDLYYYPENSKWEILE
jgi:hypothetical protein